MFYVTQNPLLSLLYYACLFAEPKVKAIVTLMEQPGSRAATSAEANDKVREKEFNFDLDYRALAACVREALTEHTVVNNMHDTAVSRTAELCQ